MGLRVNYEKFCQFVAVYKATISANQNRMDIWYQSYYIMDDLTSEKAKHTKIAPARLPLPNRMHVSNHMPCTVRKHFEELSDIRAERVRWFYFEDKKWSPFCGQESLKIEQCFRRLAKSSKTSPDLCDVCTVLGGLYDADVAKRICKPVYWKGRAPWLTILDQILTYFPSKFPSCWAKQTK